MALPTMALPTARLYGTSTVSVTILLATLILLVIACIISIPPMALQHKAPFQQSPPEPCGPSNCGVFNREFVVYGLKNRKSFVTLVINKSCVKIAHVRGSHRACKPVTAPDQAKSSESNRSKRSPPRKRVRDCAWASILETLKMISVLSLHNPGMRQAGGSSME